MMHYDEFILVIKEDNCIEAELETRDGTRAKEQAQLPGDVSLIKHINLGISHLYGKTLIDSESLKLLGEDIYRVIFPGLIGDLFEQAVETVLKTQRQGEFDRKLRLVIETDPSSAVYLWPLELMRCPRLGYWLATQFTVITFSRRLVSSAPFDFVAALMPPPLQALIVVSKPCNEELPHILAAPFLETIAKLARIEIQGQPRSPAMVATVLGKLDDFEHVEGLTYVDEPATFSNISQCTEGIGLHPHILHFIGHTKFDGDKGAALGLVNDRSEIDWCCADDFSLIFNNWRPQLVVLQPTETAGEQTLLGFTGLAAQLIQHGIQAVVAMQFNIRNACATDFISGFYDALQQGQDIDSAVQRGRWKMSNTIRWREPDFGAPVLFQCAPTRNLAPKQAQANQKQE